MVTVARSELPQCGNLLGASFPGLKAIRASRVDTVLNQLRR